MPYDNLVPLTPEEAFEKRAAAAEFKEASEFPTIATGDYKVQGDSGEAFVDKDPKVMAILPNGRVILKLKGTAFIGSERKGKITATVSPDLVRTGNVPTGKPDQKFKQWTQLVKTLFPDVAAESLAEVSVSQVMERWTKYPVGMYVTQTFKEPTGVDNKNNWYDAKTPEEVAQYRQKGLSASNFVKNIYTYKG